MHEIYLKSVSLEYSGPTIATVRGVRFLWESLDEDHGFREARDLVQRLINEPTVMQLVARNEDYLKCEAALAEVDEYTNGAATFVIDPTDLSVEVPDHEPEDEHDAESDGPFSPAALKTALILVAACEGNPTLAYVRAYQLGRATDDKSLYEEVQAVLMDSFELSFQSAGPEIHLSED